MDIGVIQAGFESVACIEVDPFCCDTLRAAVEREKRSTRILEGDIRNIDPVKLMQDLALEPGELDLLFGGPPCQAFSAIGKQNALQDERGMLLFQITHFAEVFKPKMIMIEQVKGLLSSRDHNGKAGGVFEMFLSSLRSCEPGYFPQWKVLLAADFGVPQLRERVFIVASRDKDLQFRFPDPTHHPSGQNLLGLSPYMTAGEALAGLRDPSPKDKANPPIDSHMDVTPAGDRRRIHGVPEGAWLSSQTHLPADQLCNLTKKDTTKFRRVDSHQPSITLRGGEIFFHPIEDRILTPREYMRLHGYPDSYLLKGPIRSRSGRVRYLDQHRQIANSVPPPVARAVAEAIARTLSCQPSTKSLVTV